MGWGGGVRGRGKGLGIGLRVIGVRVSGTYMPE